VIASTSDVTFVGSTSDLDKSFREQENKKLFFTGSGKKCNRNILNNTDR